jgi:hypothetical protein
LEDSERGGEGDDGNDEVEEEMEVEMEDRASTELVYGNAFWIFYNAIQCGLEKIWLLP